MYDCLSELGEWTAIFQSAVESIGQDLFTSFPVAREWGSWDHSVTSLVHRILSIQSEVDFTVEVSVLHEACRLASWLYLAEIRHRFYIRSFEYHAVQIPKLQTLLEKHNRDWGELEPLHLWVLAVAGPQARPGTERNWFVGEIKRVAGGLGINSCLEAEAQMRNLLWIDDVHGLKLNAIQGEVWFQDLYGQ
jgi:hypothetical protein